jgi:hypothetical protein
MHPNVTTCLDILSLCLSCYLSVRATRTPTLCLGGGVLPSNPSHVGGLNNPPRSNCWVAHHASDISARPADGALIMGGEGRGQARCGMDRESRLTEHGPGRQRAIAREPSWPSAAAPVVACSPDPCVAANACVATSPLDAGRRRNERWRERDRGGAAEGGRENSGRGVACVEKIRWGK